MSYDTSTCSHRRLQDRLLDKAVFDPGKRCWLFTGCLIKGSWYGQIGAGRKGVRVLVHRLSYELYCGPIPEGKQVLHTCDVRNCINPTHLFLGSNTDNVRDAIKKGRFSVAEDHYMALLTNAQVARIKRRLMTPRPGLKSHLAREYHVPRGVIIDISTGRSWRSVEPEPCQPSALA